MRLAEFGDLTTAEQTVIDGLGTGHVTKLGDGELPGEDAGEDRRVRASLIRWLALSAPGADHLRLHEKGLQIAGALVVSDGKADPVMARSTPGLDLQGCRLDHDLLMWDCRFQDTPVLRASKVQTLNLGGANLPGLQADGLEARGDVFLRGMQVKGEVRLVGVRICGNLECDGVQLENKGDKALNADGLEARGSVYLRGVQAQGDVRLVGARIGGNLECDGGRFETAGGAALSADGLEVRGDVFLRNDFQAYGEVRLLGARIGGDLDCEGGRFEHKGRTALAAQGAQVTGVFFWRAGSHADGALDLTGAEIGRINDDPARWPKAGDLLLNRCRYGAFTGQGINAAERIRWLDLQEPARFGKDFWPQPWEHCAQVLREMGHAEDARKVLIAKEERQRRVRRKEAAATLSEIRRRIAKVAREADPNDIDAHLAARSGHVGAWSTLAALRLRDGLLGALISYGHRPLRALWWLAAMWVFGAVMFGIAWGDDGFKPKSAFILRSAEWAGCYKDDDRSDEDEEYRWKDEYPSTLACYLDQPEAAGYPGFNAALYSLDTLVPVVDLEVQDYWVPDEAVAGWARGYLWVHIAMGWFLALLAVAGFSGLIDTRTKRD